MRRVLQIVVLVLCVSAGESPRATPTLMEELPSSSRFRCLNCHTVQDPGPSQAVLNPFGQAFKANGSKWDATLARQRSDSDNCTNGFELSDENGDGQLDTGRVQERSNPGEPGCTLELSEQTWSNLKKLFR